MTLARSRLARAMLAAGVALAGVAVTIPASAAATDNWPGYLGGPAHHSYAAGQVTITPTNASTIKQKWHDKGGVLASPTVVGGYVYIGTDLGYFEKIKATTGVIVAKVFLGHEPKKTCSQQGVVSTATVTGGVAYVASPDGYLYALNTTDLSVLWKSVIAIPSSTVSDYFNWSSPTVSHGRIYVGISSHCDNPLVRGGEESFSQTTGAHLATFYTVPSGSRGGSIWSSAAVDSLGNVYVTTGNAAGTVNSQYTESIVKLSQSLKPIASWTIPAADETTDADFGGSPTLFGNDVGACNKNGIYYALNAATMTLAWERRIGGPDTAVAECIGAAAYNGQDLFVAGEAITINGTAYAGSVQELTPSGTVAWRRGLPNGVDTSPSLDAGGVVAAGTFDMTATPNATYLFNASTGTILKTMAPGLDDFSQSTWASGMLFLANESGVSAWGP
jgi:outer membrane protein assembly factor BamB